MSSESNSVAIHNFPFLPTPLVGRELERETLSQLLRHPGVRLLTLTGPGGIGKTRLALQAGLDVAADFADGAAFVSLAPLSDPELVIPTIAHTLALRGADQPPLQRLIEHLHERQHLLLLDNFEQVIDAGPALVDLLAACPTLKIIVTSREVLRLSGEHEFAVPPLTLPDLERLTRAGRQPTEALAHYAAVALFIARIQTHRARFQPTNADLAAIAQICIRLDGLPLAIELAAARIRHLSPQGLLQRLQPADQAASLHLLTGGPRDLPARQRTLRHAIQWSYDLLEPAEQRLFRWLSVFVEGFTLTAAETVISHQAAGRPAAPSESDNQLLASIFAGIASLIDKSLLKQSGDSAEPRYMMLVTMREFGREQLAQHGEAPAAEQAHAGYYLELAETAGANLRGPDQAAWIQRLEQEQHNLAATLRWAIHHGEAELVLRLGQPLWSFWMFNGHFVEMRYWLKNARQIAEADLPPDPADLATLPDSQLNTLSPSLPQRAQALYTAGMIAYSPGDFDLAIELFSKSLALFRRLAEPKGIADALLGLGRSRYAQADLVAAKQLLAESLRLYQQAHDPKGIADTLYVLGRVAWSRGDYLTAQSSHEAALARQISLGNQWDMAMSHYALSLVALFQGDLPGARRRIEAALALFQTMGSQLGVTIVEVWRGWIMAYEGDLAAARETLSHCLAFGKKADGARTIIFCLVGLGDIAWQEGHLEAARTYYEEGLTTGGDRQFVAFSLEGLGLVAAAQHNFRESARCFGAAEALRQAKAMPLPPFKQVGYERQLEQVRRQLEPTAFSAAWAEGPRRYAHLIEDTRPVEATLARAARPPLVEPLTPRELDVLRLVARGLTNAQVGQELVISPRTVDAHLRSIYGKLEVTSRAAATRFALEHQLV